MTNFIREEKGITLIALVVTIIVILILAGVAISLAIGNNDSIVHRAYDAGQIHANALQNESIALNEFDEEAGNVINKVVYN